MDHNQRLLRRVCLKKALEYVETEIDFWRKLEFEWLEGQKDFKPKLIEPQLKITDDLNLKLSE